MAYDCTAAQTELDELKAARKALVTGKRVVSSRDGENEASFAQVSLPALNSLIAEKEAEMRANGCTLDAAPLRRFAQPILGSGRCE